MKHVHMGEKVKNKKKFLKSVTTEKSHIFTVLCPTYLVSHVFILRKNLNNIICSKNVKAVVKFKVNPLFWKKFVNIFSVSLRLILNSLKLIFCLISNDIVFASVQRCDHLFDCNHLFPKSQLSFSGFGVISTDS